ncbi:MAG TPA: SDR family oxidoreductase [Alphaproteobacteria bacterium]|nr:SDR family oxidoreductase [Alphaproteobacteria bacterium]
MRRPAGRITPAVDFTQALGGLFDLDGQIAFVAGGYGGLGEAIAWGLAQRGARVVIAGRVKSKAEALAGSLMRAGHDAVGVAMDATRVRQIEQAVAGAVKRYGGVDILVNCIGVHIEEPLCDVTEAAFDEVYRVNLKAAMFLGQAVAKRQIAAGRGGKQIHLLSVRAQLGLRDRGYSAYCSTKGGLLMLVKQHAMELARHKINVNGIAPTFVYTEMIRHVMENPKFRRALHERIPLGRIADPKDVVGAALFFAAPASDFVTGQILYVDGGITASQ